MARRKQKSELSDQGLIGMAYSHARRHEQRLAGSVPPPRARRTVRAQHAGICAGCAKPYEALATVTAVIGPDFTNHWCHWQKGGRCVSACASRLLVQQDLDPQQRLAARRATR